MRSLDRQFRAAATFAATLTATLSAATLAFTATLSAALADLERRAQQELVRMGPFRVKKFFKIKK